MFTLFPMIGVRTIACPLANSLLRSSAGVTIIQVPRFGSLLIAMEDSSRDGISSKVVGRITWDDYSLWVRLGMVHQRLFTWRSMVSIRFSVASSIFSRYLSARANWFAHSLLSIS